MHYRREIDGLRAVAILPVIWIHSGLPFLTGGFLGVDVFFVISGFLITSILLKEFDQDNFSLARFYERRARRILPALFFVIAITTLLVPLVNSNPQFIADFGSSVLSTVLFFSNVYFWQTSGYFGSASELSPMLHTWSLAVEEQYYIFFPLLLMMLFSYGKKVIVAAIIVISIVSLGISEWGAVNSPIANFYLLPSRAWELMAGALASIAYLHPTLVNVRQKFSVYFATIGLVFIAVAYITFSPATLHPSSLTIMPVVGTVLVLLFANQNNVVGKLLSINVLSFIGLISYSLYLWHQPILALMKKSYGLHLELHQIIIANTLIFMLSYVTWKFVENPFRNRQKFTQTRIFKYSLVSIVAVSLISIVIKQNLLIQRVLFPQEMARYQKMLDANTSHTDQVMYDKECKFWSDSFKEEFVSRFEDCSKQYRKAIFVLGGSHGMDLYNAVAMNADNPFVVSVSQGFCRAHKFIGSRKDRPKCQYDDFKRFVTQYAAHIDYVIYTQTPDRLFTKNYLDLDKASIDELSLELVDEVVSYLADIKQQSKVKVLMLGMLPPMTDNPINWDYNREFSTQFNDIVSANALDLTKSVDKIFQAKLDEKKIPYFSKFDAFALSIPNDLIVDGKITYSDRRHLSYDGEKIFGKRLMSYLANQGYADLNSRH